MPASPLRVVFLGPSGVGKTSLVNRLAFETFSDVERQTVGACFHPLVLRDSTGRSIEFNLWDTAGQERYASLARSYLRNADIAVCCFSLDVVGSVEALEQLRQTVADVAPGADLLIILAKTDLKARFDDAETIEVRGRRIATASSAIFVQASAKTEEGMDSIREELIKIAHTRVGDQTPPQEPTIQVLAPQEALSSRGNAGGCC
jgi:small GTP-binding protein